MTKLINTAKAVSVILVPLIMLGACQNSGLVETASSSHLDPKSAPQSKPDENADRFQKQMLEFRENYKARLRTRSNQNKVFTSNERNIKKSDGKYEKLIRKYARAEGVPFSLARAVVKIESNFHADARGGAGEVGLMQIKPSTARGMGFRGSVKDLYSPEINIRWGMKYLGGAHRLSNGTTCETILKYNAGHGANRMNKTSSKYCVKVKQLLKS